eukprot:4532070-Prymnesium_polylepis.2
MRGVNDLCSAPARSLPRRLPQARSLLLDAVDACVLIECQFAGWSNAMNRFSWFKRTVQALAGKLPADAEMAALRLHRERTVPDRAAHDGPAARGGQKGRGPRGRSHERPRSWRQARRGPQVNAPPPPPPPPHTASRLGAHLGCANSTGLPAIAAPSRAPAAPRARARHLAACTRRPHPPPLHVAPATRP